MFQMIMTKILTIYLKSNMDRFIVSQVEFIHILICYLKSNMDRFIAAYDISSRSTSEIFKIQYG